MVVSSRCARRDRRVAGVEQREAAGAVGRFHHAGLEAALPDGRGLLVAGDAEDADRRRRTDPAASCRNRRRSRAPPAAARPARRTARAAPRPIGRCGCRAAACAPHWWRRSRAPCRRSAATAGSVSTVPKASLPGLRRLARARHVVEQPGDLGRREIRIEQQPGALGDQLLVARRARSAAQASAVRRSCQTMALWIGLPVARSQTIVVSRWLVMPIAATSFAATPALAIAARTVATDGGPDFLRVVLDPAGRADRSAETPAARSPTGASASSNTIARVEVVPWSMARRWLGNVGLRTRLDYSAAARPLVSMNRVERRDGLRRRDASPSLDRRHSTSSAVSAHSWRIR